MSSSTRCASLSERTSARARTGSHRSRPDALHTATVTDGSRPDARGGRRPGVCGAANLAPPSRRKREQWLGLALYQLFSPIALGIGETYDEPF